MEKTVLVAFNGEMMCFVHVLLNALDMQERGGEPLVVFEGAAVKLVPELERPSNPFAALYDKAKNAGLIAGVCRACSAKLGVLEEVKASGLPLLDDMSGHPSLGAFMEKGYRVLTF
ncbi:MAG: DsrE family protein [Desulfovibrionaceae bacterium]